MGVRIIKFLPFPRILVPLRARRAVGFGFVGVIICSGFCGRGAAGSPNGGPGLGDEGWASAGEEEQGEQI